MRRYKRPMRHAWFMKFKWHKITVIVRKYAWKVRGSQLMQYIHQSLFASYPISKLGRTPCLCTNQFTLIHLNIKSFGLFQIISLWCLKVLEHFSSFHFDLEKFWNDLVRSTLILKSFGTIWSVPFRSLLVLKVFGSFYLPSSDILEHASSFFLRSQKFLSTFFLSSSILKIFE